MAISGIVVFTAKAELTNDAVIRDRIITIKNKLDPIR